AGAGARGPTAGGQRAGNRGGRQAGRGRLPGGERAGGGSWRRGDRRGRREWAEERAKGPCRGRSRMRRRGVKGAGGFPSPGPAAILRGPSGHRPGRTRWEGTEPRFWVLTVPESTV